MYSASFLSIVVEIFFFFMIINFGLVSFVTFSICLLLYLIL